MSYTTYLFDFDYTLADSSRGIVTCFRNVLNRHGYIKPTDEDIKRTIGKTLEDSFSILSGVTDAQQLADFKKEYVKEADTHMTVNTVLFLETKSVLIALKDAGANIGIISTKFRYRIQELLNQHFPSDFLDIIIGGEDVKAAKPSPEGLLLAIKQLRVNKAETLYIGDSTVDAETARAAGVDFAGITHGVTTAQELRQYPHKRIMSTLEELLEEEKTPDAEQSSENEQTPEPLVSAKLESSAIRPKEKSINILQILLLLILLWLSYEVMDLRKSFLFFAAAALILGKIMQTRRVIPHRLRTFIAPWWLPFERHLRAFHVKVGRGKKTPPINTKSVACLNCGNTYVGNYCNRCGQNRNTPHYRLNNAFRNILGGFTNIDNGFGRTLLELLYRPGHMIRDFINGRRVHYFRPFQTLFVLAALYIMCVQLVDPDALKEKEQEKSNPKELIDTKGLESKSDTLIAIPQTPVVSEDERVIEDVLKTGSSVNDKLEEYFSHSPFLMKVWNLLKSWGHGNKAFRIIATLPLFALATLLVFRKEKNKLNYNFTEHIFVQAYIACQTLLLSILILPINGTAQTNDLYEVPLWSIFALFCWDYKQLYRCTWWKSFWSTIVMLFYALLLVMVFAVIVILLTIGGIYLLSRYL